MLFFSGACQIRAILKKFWISSGTDFYQQLDSSRLATISKLKLKI